jgi:hypothetical protein
MLSATARDNADIEAGRKGNENSTDRLVFSLRHSFDLDMRPNDTECGA